MTDAKPVADLRRIALKGETFSERLAALNELADRAEAAEHACDENASEVMRLQGELAEARARIANEIAARQRAQEHGIGDRARIEELERERDAERGRYVDLHGQCDLSIDQLEKERDQALARLEHLLTGKR